MTEAVTLSNLILMIAIALLVSDMAESENGQTLKQTDRHTVTHTDRQTDRLWPSLNSLFPSQKNIQNVFT